MTDKRATVIGWVLSGLVLLFLAMDAAMKFAVMQPVIDATGQLGWPTDATTIRTLATILTVSALLYAWPRTAVLGAILLTGYFGGAVASQARLGDPLFSHVLFGVYLGVIAWGGLWFRDPRVRALIPLAR